MSNRVIIQGTIEYLDVVVTADENLAGTVELSFDQGTTWTAAAWLGTAATTRTARLLLDTTATTGTPPVLVWPEGNYPVWVRLTDTPEIPIVSAGSLRVT
jgi:hypothetical protein